MTKHILILLLSFSPILLNAQTTENNSIDGTYFGQKDPGMAEMVIYIGLAVKL